MSRWLLFARLERDVRYAVRSLRRAPVFAAGVIGTIAIALGLNATVFTIFNAYVLRPLAVRDPGALYSVTLTGRNDEGTFRERWMEWESYQLIPKTSSDVVTGALVRRDAQVRLDRAASLGEMVSGNYFQVLGVNAIRGRTLVPGDAAAPGEGAVIVLSHRMWKARFDASRDAIGTTIVLRGTPFTIVGVIGPEFTGLTEVPVDFWAPITMTRALEGDAARLSPNEPFPRGRVYVRLAPGVTPEEAAATLTRRLTAASAWVYGSKSKVTGAILEPSATTIPMTLEFLNVVLPIAIAFGLVLCIACANVANMMLARGLARQRELGIRMALGAGRRHVIGQLVTEAVLLALPAAILGYLISRGALDFALSRMFATFPASYVSYLRIVPLTPDLRVFLFMLLAAVTAALLFGLAPAYQVTRRSVIDATRGTLEGERHPARLRNGLAMMQVAGCLLLLVTAGVFLRGSQRARQVETGWKLGTAVQVEVAEPARAGALATLRAIPGVRGVAASLDPPAFGMYQRVPLGVAGRREVQSVHFNRVSPDYFAAVGMEVREGRTFTPDESNGGEAVVILSEAGARRLSPATTAVGLQLRLDASDQGLNERRLSRFRTARVVGVVNNTVAGMVFTGLNKPIAYFPASADSSGAWLLATVAGEPAAAARDIETALERAHPGSVNQVAPLEASLEGQIYPLRAASWISGVLGGIALLLTLSGIYGVLAYLVSQRTREFGIRLALGARRDEIVGMVLRQSLRLAAIGGAVGLALAAGVSRIFAIQTDTVLTTWDPVAYFGSAGVGLLACLVAGWVPSRRAAAVDPLEALRSE